LRNSWILEIQTLWPEKRPYPTIAILIWKAVSGTLGQSPGWGDAWGTERAGWGFFALTAAPQSLAAGILCRFFGCLFYRLRFSAGVPVKRLVPRNPKTKERANTLER